MSVPRKPRPNLSKYATYATILIFAATALAILTQLLTGSDQVLYWKSDYAIFLIDMYHASQFDQEIGISSRFGWAHPGPFNYYMLVPWYSLFGEKEIGLILGTYLYNIGFIAASTWTVAKVSDRKTAALFLTTLVIYSTIALGAKLFLDVLLPYSTIFPWIFALCISIAIIQKHSHLIPLLALTLSCVTQMHVAFWMPAVVLGLSTLAGSLLHKRPERKEILLWIAAACLFAITWIPPLHEFNNISKIFGFFTSRPSSDHSLLDAAHALAVLMGEPIRGAVLSYGEARPGGLPLYLGFLAITASIFCTLAAWKNNNKTALILGYLVLLQLITYLYALSKVAGPILHHSITFIPMITVFIALQALLFINQRLSNAHTSTMLTVIGSLASLFFIATHYQQITSTVAIAKTPDEKIARLYADLEDATHRCTSTPTINMNQPLWEPAIGAVSAAYRNGQAFSITPSFWSIIFGWRVPTQPTQCVISFIQKNDRTAVEVRDFEKIGRVEGSAVMILDTLVFEQYGTALFDKASLRVSSETFTDAGFLSQELTLPAGSYRINTTLTWSATPEKLDNNAGHLSFHGSSIIYAINKPVANDEPITAYFTSNEKPFRLSFGLGGWSNGKGYVQLKSLQIERLKEQ
ncbi:hypothetical protein ACQJ22_14385 [Pseudomonas fragariae (ex Marin et al. 2024)]|uniref:Glycosyltransferase RgtA/B/C/D-like domain-containing protein n=1 Tax=Pseudomonas syringae pv. apii TaxID=81036 RepID=A0A3M5WQN7_9PSED|nr:MULTISPECIES: hypothetical protein [Pseudomonas syringae group]AKF44523.1 hypothetical protein PsyrB_04985 [Pseudomonas syringae pv. syringae B301D]EXL30626.1 hypothetical protein PssB301D_03142 [Pseudomonas syringae pv. syringae str. B301D-R]RMU71887.1 hypothetical protein ALP23_03492 [Pseudomonas syringae pv. apii]